MIHFNYETDFLLSDEDVYATWISNVIASEGKTEGEITYIFCDDAFLLDINQKFLQHDDYTDIISFDYSVGKKLQGDVFVSIERVRENAAVYKALFEDELKRVMVHGILHYCGFKDKTESEAKLMRMKENEKIFLFNNVSRGTMSNDDV